MGSQLADEISDVVDEHGRGLEADEICSTIEQVARRVDGQFDHEISSRELERELQRFVDHWSDAKNRDECLETLRAIAESLRDSSLTPDVEYRHDSQREAIALTFDSAFALRQKIPKLLDIRGYFVETDTFPITRDDIVIAIESRHLAESIELSGRVLRSAPNGVAIQIDDISPETRRRLRGLVDRMRETRQRESTT